MGIWEFLLAVILIGVVGFGAFVGLIVWGIRKAARSLKGGTTLELPEYQYLDETAGAPAETLASILKRYQRADGVSPQAKKGLAQVENARRKRDSLHATISGKFSEGSLTWDKFIVAVDAAYQVLLVNLTQLTNRVQTFDVEDFRQQKRERATSAFKRDGIPDEVQDQRWGMMQASLKEMDGILAANEKLLLDLDKFAAELGQLDQSGSADSRTNEMLEEIRQLTEEMKYYRQ